MVVRIIGKARGRISKRLRTASLIRCLVFESWIWVWISGLLCMRLYVQCRICVCMYVCIRVCVYVYIYSCKYIHVYIMFREATIYEWSFNTLIDCLYFSQNNLPYIHSQGLHTCHSKDYIHIIPRLIYMSFPRLIYISFQMLTYMSFQRLTYMSFPRLIYQSTRRITYISAWIVAILYSSICSEWAASIEFISVCADTWPRARSP